MRLACLADMNIDVPISDEKHIEVVTFFRSVAECCRCSAEAANSGFWLANELKPSPPAGHGRMGCTGGSRTANICYFASLLELSPAEPDLHEVLVDIRWQKAGPTSRRARAPAGSAHLGYLDGGAACCCADCRAVGKPWGTVGDCTEACGRDPKLMLKEKGT